MKIGQVVREYGVPVNTLYFYISKGLLVPPRRNGQYVFDQRTLEELAWILELKEMRFPLKTIHRLLSLRRISNFCAREDVAELRRLYLDHDGALAQQQRLLLSARRRLAESLERYGERPAGARRTGVPLEMLPLLRCPRCGGELLLEGAAMSQQYIFSASLGCPCGYSAAIRDGILETGQVNTSPYDWPDTGRAIYRDLPSPTLSLFEQSYRWLEEKLRERPARGEVWLEGHVNAWFFFHNHLELLRPGDRLIVIDKFPETLRAYKAVIEAQGGPKDILYIADSSDTPPLRPRCVDCGMDFFSSNERNFYRPGFYPETLLPYLKPGGELFGVYFYFQNGPRSLRRLKEAYPEASADSFRLRWFLGELERSFRVAETADCGASLDSGDSFGLGFHAPGEALHLQAYHARAKNQPASP